MKNFFKFKQIRFSILIMGLLRANQEINIENLTITITEIDSLDNGGCFCLCLFDVNYKITNLPPGQYRVVFEEPYKIESDPVLDITIDLISSPSGDHCVPRTQYPWGQ